MSEDKVIQFKKPDREMPEAVKENIEKMKVEYSEYKKEYERLNSVAESNNVERKEMRQKIHPEKGRDIEGEELINRSYPRDRFTDDDLAELIEMLEFTVDSGSYVYIAKVLLDELQSNKVSIKNRFEFNLSFDELKDMANMLCLGHALNEEHLYSGIARKILQYDDEIYVQNDERVKELVAQNDLMTIEMISKPVWERFY